MKVVVASTVRQFGIVERKLREEGEERVRFATAVSDLHGRSVEEIVLAGPCLTDDRRYFDMVDEIYRIEGRDGGCARRITT